MKTIVLALGLALSGTLLAAGVVTRHGPQDAPTLTRKQAVYELVLKWGPSAARAQGRSIHEWADSMVPLFATADVANLNKALSAKSYGAMAITLTGAKTAKATKLASGLTPQSLGSLTSDLVFTPLASCVIVDTRPSSGGGGPFTPGAVRHFKASGANFTAQGGSATNCGIPAGIGSLLVGVSAISPTSAGYFRLWPYSLPMPTASNISYATGQNIQNEIVMATSVGLAQDFSVQSAGSSNIVINVLGYFAANVATALECATVASTAVPVAAGANGQAFAPACTAGYSRTGVFCDSGIYDAVISNQGDVYGCVFKNNSASAINVYARSRCCRVPGR